MLKLISCKSLILLYFIFTLGSSPTLAQGEAGRVVLLTDGTELNDVVKRCFEIAQPFIAALPDVDEIVQSSFNAYQAGDLVLLLDESQEAHAAVRIDVLIGLPKEGVAPVRYGLFYGKVFVNELARLQQIGLDNLTQFDCLALVIITTHEFVYIQQFKEKRGGANLTNANEAEKIAGQLAWNMSEGDSAKMTSAADDFFDVHVAAQIYGSYGPDSSEWTAMMVYRLNLLFIRVDDDEGKDIDQYFTDAGTRVGRTGDLAAELPAIVKMGSDIVSAAKASEMPYDFDGLRHYLRAFLFIEYYEGFVDDLIAMGLIGGEKEDEAIKLKEELRAIINTPSFLAERKKQERIMSDYRQQLRDAQSKAAKDK